MTDSKRSNAAGEKYALRGIYGSEPYWPQEKLKICVTGAGGFIASHLSKRLKEEGHFVRAVDWKENEYMPQDTFCDEFLNLDLRWPENCKKAVEGFDWCFNLAVRLCATSHAA